MQLGRCPVCHSRIGLEQIIQDDAGRELLALLSRLDSTSGHASVSYLGLFRSANRDLANDRALKLANEVQQLEAWQWLTPALQETIESLKEKRAQGEVKPLANHNYLKRVLESVVSRGISHQPLTRAAIPAEADYRSAEASAARLKDTSWA